jgi:hypothetical protein
VTETLLTGASDVKGREVVGLLVVSLLAGTATIPYIARRVRTRR